jgi:hypothetical protein
VIARNRNQRRCEREDCRKLLDIGNRTLQSHVVDINLERTQLTARGRWWQIVEVALKCLCNTMPADSPAGTFFSTCPNVYLTIPWFARTFWHWREIKGEL